MTDGVSLADIAAVTDNKDSMFGGAGGGMWIFALLILLLIGGEVSLEITEESTENQLQKLVFVML